MLKRIELFCSLRLLVFIAFTLLLQASAWCQEKPRVSPKLIRGQVVDMAENPIAGAKVKYFLRSWDKEDDKQIEHAKGTLKCGADGSFEFKVKDDVPKDRDLFLSVDASSKVHFDRSFEFDGDKVWQEEVEIGPMKLDRGVRVVGELQGPLETSGKVEKATVFLAASDSQRSNQVYRFLNCDEEGKFNCLVPNNSTLDMTLGAMNFAQVKLEKEIKVESSVENDGDIPQLDLGVLRLNKGVSVSGVATRLDGSPAVGVAVVIAEWEGNQSDFEVSEDDPNEYKGVGHLSAVKTDAKGKFELPPHEGKCTLFVIQACRSREFIDGEQQVIRSDVEDPFFKPLNLDLDKMAPGELVKLQELETMELSGTVYNATGKAVPNVRVQYAWYSIFGPVSFKQVSTGRDGSYKIKIGKGLRPQIQLSHDGQERALVTAETVEDYPDLFYRAGDQEQPLFKPVEKNVTHINWELLPPESVNDSMLKKVGKAVQWWFSGD
jgi:hypothetical protein